MILTGPLMKGCVKAPVVHTPEYSPDFRPLMGKIEVLYNGCVLRIWVEGTQARVDVTAIDIDHTFGIKWEREFQHTWHEILQKAMQEMLIWYTTIAIQQLDMLRASAVMGGPVHVH